VTLKQALLATTLVFYALPSVANTQNYFFAGYGSCKKGQIGCTQWVNGNWVFNFVYYPASHDYCKQLQDVSRGLTVAAGMPNGTGGCTPTIQ